MRISDWSSDVCSSDLVGPAAAIPGKLARFVPTFLTDAAETPRKNLRLDRHGDPWVAVHPVRLLRHGAVPVPAEPYVLGQGRGTAEVVAVRAVVVSGADAVAARGDRPERVPRLLRTRAPEGAPRPESHLRPARAPRPQPPAH